MKFCSVPDCGKKLYGKGLCSMHYTRLRNHGDINTVKLIRNIGLCSVEGCDRPMSTIGMCRMHSARYYTKGDIGPVQALKKPSGEGYINEDGYKVLYHEGKRIFEHVKVAEQALGKKLLIGVQVHHLNGERPDNRPENLVVCPNQEYHRLLHRRQKELGWAGPALTSESEERKREVLEKANKLFSGLFV